jgi:hypothetical protein
MGASRAGWGRILIAAACAAAMARAASAQVPPPPPSPEAADIASCLCLKRDVDALNAESTASRREYDDLQAELGRVDAQLEAERSRMDVNNPESVSRFRQLLARRDDLFRRSTTEVAAHATSSADRYNSRVNEYNSRCANRPRDPRLLAQVEATLVCPPAH